MAAVSNVKEIAIKQWKSGWLQNVLRCHQHAVLENDKESEDETAPFNARIAVSKEAEN